MELKIEDLEDRIFILLLKYIKSLPYTVDKLDIHDYSTLERLAVTKAHHHLENYLLNFPDLDLKSSKIKYSNFRWKNAIDIASPDGIGKFVLEFLDTKHIIYAVYEFKLKYTGKSAWRQIVTYSLLASFYGKRKNNLYVIGLTIGNFGTKITNGILILPFTNYSVVFANYTSKRLKEYYVINNKCLRNAVGKYNFKSSIRKILMETFPQLYFIENERRTLSENHCVLGYDTL